MAPEARGMRTGPSRQEKALEHLRRFGPLTSAQLAEALGLSAGSARDTVWRLRKDGKVHQHGMPPYLYSVVPA